MNKTRLSTFTAVLLAITLFASGCSIWSKAATGAVVGAGGGAAVGAVIGKTLGNTAAGAIAGAAVGGTVGAIIGRNMDNKARELQEQLEGVTVQRVEEGIALTFDNGILFGFDSSALRTEGQDNLQQLARIIDRDDETILLIVGHTDSVGDENYNLSLSERRATAAKDYMAARGLAAYRIQVEGRGEHEPLASNDTETGRQENRRIEVAIYASPSYVDRLMEAN